MRWSKNRGRSRINGRRKSALAGSGRAGTAGYLNFLRRRCQSGTLPMVLAAVFFLAAAVCALLYMENPEKQAGRLVKDLYTVNQYQGKDAVLAEEIPGVYRREFGRRMTKEGLEAVVELSLPYGLLARERPVDRTYAEIEELREAPRMPETAAEDASVKRYTYKIMVETHFIRDGEVVQPVTQEMYTGTVRVKKSGLFLWKLDKITKSAG